MKRFNAAPVFQNLAISTGSGSLALADLSAESVFDMGMTPDFFWSRIGGYGNDEGRPGTGRLFRLGSSFNQAGFLPAAVFADGHALALLGKLNEPRTFAGCNDALAGTARKAFSLHQSSNDITRSSSTVTSMCIH